LVVGVRSPAALELVRQLDFHGLAVEGADFLHFPLGRFSCRLKRYHRLPSPRWQTRPFEKQLAALLAGDYAAVFACNEEIFWLSARAQGVWDHPDVLERLHRKDTFVSLLEECGLPAPRTEALEAWSGSPQEVVLKRVYSRFGESTWLQPTIAQIGTLRRQSGWLAQQKLSGSQICLTGFAWRGKLLCVCCYHSRWGGLGGASHGGAGLFFAKCAKPELEDQARKLAAYLNFSGPFGLDFVGGTAVECNPRWTSGIHLLDLTPVFQALSLPTRSDSTARERAQLAAPMLLRGRFTREFWHDWCSARDVVWDPHDPGPALAQPLALAEQLWRAKRQKISLSQAMTWDIEWNGPDDVAAM